MQSMNRALILAATLVAAAGGYAQTTAQIQIAPASVAPLDPKHPPPGMSDKAIQRAAEHRKNAQARKTQQSATSGAGAQSQGTEKSYGQQNR